MNIVIPQCKFCLRYMANQPAAIYQDGSALCHECIDKEIKNIQISDMLKDLPPTDPSPMLDPQAPASMGSGPLPVDKLETNTLVPNGLIGQFAGFAPHGLKDAKCGTFDLPQELKEPITNKFAKAMLAEAAGHFADTGKMPIEENDLGTIDFWPTFKYSVMILATMFGFACLVAAGTLYAAHAAGLV